MDAAVEALRSALAACMPAERSVTADINIKLVNQAISSAASGLLMLRYEQARQNAKAADQAARTKINQAITAQQTQQPQARKR